MLYMTKPQVHFCIDVAGIEKARLKSLLLYVFSLKKCAEKDLIKYSFLTSFFFRSLFTQMHSVLKTTVEALSVKNNCFWMYLVL